MASKKAQPKRPRGRPKGSVEYELDEYAESICEWLATGKTLRAWCESSQFHPTFRTVYGWMHANPDFFARAQVARQMGCDALADEMSAVASTPPTDQLDLNWKKLRIDTVLRLLSKWDPRRYGDRQQVDHGGGVSINVITGVPKRDQADS